MNDMYRDEDYRNNYRGDYRDNYRDNYRDDYRSYRDYRDEYGRNQRYARSNRERNYRNYRDKEEYHAMLADVIDDGMELARAYEDISEMASNTKDKQTLMKLAEREKEGYRAVKEMMEHTM